MLLQTDWYAALGEILLYFGNRMVAEVEDTGGEGGVGVAGGEDVVKVLRSSGAARGDDGDDLTLVPSGP